MVVITIQGYLTLKERIGKRQLALPVGSSLQDLFARLQQDFDMRFEFEGTMNHEPRRAQPIVLLNGVHLKHLTDGLSTRLNDGDQVAIFPPIAGG